MKCASLLVLSFFLSSYALADDVGAGLTVRGDFTGNWTDPVQNRQGVQIEIVDARRAVIAWFSYDNFGEPTWLFGVGEVDNKTIRAEMLRFGGGAFPPLDSDPDAIEQEVWGDVTLSFATCDDGIMSWDPVLPGLESGDMPIFRVTQIEGLRCGAAEEFERVATFSLDAGPGRWQGIFAGFGSDQQDSQETEAVWTDLQAPLSSRRGFRLAGTNRSEDLAMLAFVPLGGLAPTAEYRLEFDLTFATNVPQGCADIGLASGEAIAVKVGASGIEPSVIEEDGEFRFKIDKGNQSSDGPDAIVVGDMTNSQDCKNVGFPGTGSWELKTVTSRDREFFATTDAEERLWVYALSDSGSESRTTFFITDFTARMQPSDSPGR